MDLRDWVQFASAVAVGVFIGGGALIAVVEWWQARVSRANAQMTKRSR